MSPEIAKAWRNLYDKIKPDLLPELEKVRAEYTRVDGEFIKAGRAMEMKERELLAARDELSRERCERERLSGRGGANGVDYGP